MAESGDKKEAVVLKDETGTDKKSQPIEGRCQLYLQRKRRFCRAVPPKEGKYCVEHSHLLGEGVTRKRIPCPLDPKHTCYEDQLKNHLKKCNARESLQPVFYTKNINLGSCEEQDKDLKITVRSVATEEVLQMVERVRSLYAAHVPEIREELLSHDALKEEIENPMNGDAAKKHLKQQSSLVGHMDNLGLLRDKLCYIEFGAGKGGLSHWVQKAASQCQNNKYLLVEKGSIRYKMDSHHKGEDQGPNFERLRIDIQHLCLDQVASLRDNKDLPIIGMGKHLCGGATDLMLRCLMQQAHASQSKSETHIGHVEAIVLALCCHHRCDWQTYVGKKFFTDLGLGAREFHLVCSMTSWATCATRTFLQKLAERDEADRNEEISVKRGAEGNGEGDESVAKKPKVEKISKATNPDNNNANVEAPNTTASKFSDSTDANSEHDVTDASQTEDADYFHPRYGTQTPEEREEVGYQCKELIDMGRLKYIEELGFDARLVKYTTSEFSLEKVALLAMPKSKS